MHDHYKSKTCVIANGDTKSSAVELEAYECVGALIPTLTSGTLKVQVSQDAGPTPGDATFVDLFDGDGQAICQWLTATTGGRAWAGEGCGAGASLRAMTGFRWMRFVSGTAQGADRTFTLIFKDAGY